MKKVEIKDIQDIINSRAEKRLDKDIAEICRFAIHNELLSDETGLTPTIFESVKDSKMHNTTLRAMLGFAGEFYNKLKANWLPTYIKEESELFLSEFESLKEQVNSLTDEVSIVKQEKEY